MKKIFAHVIVVFFLLLANLANAGEAVKITGYNPGEFAVKAEQTLQLRPLLTELVRLKANNNITVVVEGGADKTGKEPENDRLGESRAEQIASTIRAELGLSKDQVVVKTVGSDFGERAVKVSFAATPTQTAPTTTVSSNKPFVVVAIIVLLIIVGATVVIVFKRKKKVPVRFSFQEHEYLYLASTRIVGGKQEYKSLYKNKDGVILWYQDTKSLMTSVKKVLRDAPELFNTLKRKGAIAEV